MKDRLSVTGLMRAVEGGVLKATKTAEKFDWCDALADAAIVSGIGFFAAFGGTGLAGVPSKEAIWAATVTAAVQFLTIMGLKRGLITKKASA